MLDIFCDVTHESIKSLTLSWDIVAKATFKLSNEARVPFAVHPKGGALLPRLVVASPRRSFGYAFVEAPRYGTKSLPLPPMGIFEMGSIHRGGAVFSALS